MSRMFRCRFIPLDFGLLFYSNMTLLSRRFHSLVLSFLVAFVGSSLVLPLMHSFLLFFLSSSSLSSTSCTLFLLLPSISLTMFICVYPAYIIEHGREAGTHVKHFILTDFSPNQPTIKGLRTHYGIGEYGK